MLFLFRTAIGFLFLATLLSSCVTLPTFDKSLLMEEEVETPNSSKQILNYELIYLQKENDELSEKFKKQVKENKRLRETNQLLQEKINALPSPVKEIKRHQTVKKIEPIKKETLITKKKSTIENIVKKKRLQDSAIRVRVLSGTGSLDTAKDLSKKVNNYGLKVESLGFASRDNYEETTIFYAKGSEVVAQELAGELGGSCLVKKMSWNSVFNVIVVSGQKP